MTAVVTPRDNPLEESAVDSLMIAAAERRQNSDINSNRLDNRHDRVWVIGIALFIAFGLGWAGGSYSDRFLTVAVEKKSATPPASPESTSTKSRVNSTIAASEAPRPGKGPTGTTITADRAQSPVNPPRLSAPTSDQISSLLQERPSAPQPAVRTPALETRPPTIAGWTVRDVQSGRATLEGPGGVWTAAIGDSVPGVGKVESIVLWGGYWVVATSRGLIATH